MDDVDLAKSIAQGFLAELPEHLSRLKSSIAAGDSSKAAQIAHRLKGAAGTIGGEALHAVAGGLQQAGQAGRIDELKSLLARAEKEGAALGQALSEFIQP